MTQQENDVKHTELSIILETLIENDIDITAREIARRHTLLTSASSITRHPERRRIMQEAQERQAELRQWKGRLAKTSKNNLAARLVDQDQKVQELERKVEILAQGHIALIAAVAQMGGMAKLVKYYENFREVRNGLLSMNALPSETIPKPVSDVMARASNRKRGNESD